MRSLATCASLLVACSSSATSSEPSTYGGGDSGGSGFDVSMLVDSTMLDSATEVASTSDSRTGEAGDTTFDDGVPDPAFPGTWMPLPGAPAACGNMVSAEPAKAAPPFKWIACPSGRSGCRQLEVDWLAPSGAAFDLPYHPAYVWGGTTYLLHKRRVVKVPDDKKYRFLIVLTPLDGTPTLVLRVDLSRPVYCYSGASIGAFGFGAAGNTSTDDAPFVISMPWSATAPSAAALDLKLLGPPTPKWIQRQATGVADLFVEAYGPDGTGVFRFATAAVSSAKAPVEFVVGVKDGAVGIDFATRALGFVRTDGTWVDLVAPGPSLTVTDVAPDHANGDALVWAESSTDVATGFYGPPTLWTSPYAVDASGVKRRKVAVLADTLGAGASGMVINEGMALVQTNASTATLIRLSDGVGWTIKAEPGQVVAGPVWVDATEVIVGVKAATFPGPLTSLQRLRRDSLGPPTLSSGL